MKYIKEAKLKNKIILLRDDLNVTMDINGHIIDDIRVVKSLDTIKYLLKKDVKKIIIVSHLGRPIIGGTNDIKKVISGNKGLILKPVAEVLAKHLKIKYTKIEATYIKDFKLPFYKINDKIWVMENIRFASEEEKNDPFFAKQMSNLADIYVDDAFANAHRKHASMVAITNYIPSYMGILFEKEIMNLGNLLKNPPKPFILILGGAKVSEKIMILKRLIRKASKILLGGVMANTFLASRNIDMKNSTVDKDSINIAKELYESSAKKFFLPTDLEWRNGMAIDIGKTTINQFTKIISEGETIFWNGTMGLTSMGNFKYSYGTRMIIKAIVESSAKEKIVCGGDTIAEVEKQKMIKRFNHVSTGGGAALAFLAEKKLPALEALKQN